MSITVLVLASLAVLGIAANRQPDPVHKNLQVLPKDISVSDLDSIMFSYTKALGVSCGFCHDAVPGTEDSLNYVTDDNRMKENARQMMRMTIDINSRYFYFDKKVKPVYLKTVHCYTCHKGEPYPAE